MEQELNSLSRINDNFPKYIVVGTPTPTYQTPKGITIMNIYDFLMNNDSLSV